MLPTVMVGIYGELKKASPTAGGEVFVAPGDAGKSYPIMKLEGKQAALNATCRATTAAWSCPPSSR